MKGFLIAGTSSGVGKTTVSLAIAAAFRSRGLVVQAFKCGPDFLDTGHLSTVTGRPARNLDGWMLDAAANRAVFDEAMRDAEIAIVEGAMGLFDGASGEGEKGSAAEIAKLLLLPVILVVDASKSARSIAAVIRGFEVFDPELRFAGVVLNGVAGEGHFRLLADAIAQNCTTPILGWLPHEQTVSIPERHLGLHTAYEIDWCERRNTLAAFAARHLDLELLLGLGFDVQRAHKQFGSAKPDKRVSIGVARDEAFCFYYQDNLDLLQQTGAQIIEFSPLRDAYLPDGLDALYFGGGYPELHAEQLSANTSLAQAVRAFAEAGRPIYAECGGMMYLGKSLRTRNGRTHPMVGVLPIQIEMTKNLVRFGYVEIELLADCLLGSKGSVFRGHSFHFSEVMATADLPAAFEARYTLSGLSSTEGYSYKNVLASYIHLHFRNAPSIAKHFVTLAESVSRSLLEAQ